MSAAREAHALERLVFFSDAVFAIAITLLVIEVHAPERLPAFTSAALWQALAGSAPGLFAFAVSFAVIGVFWTSHHRAFALLGRADERLVRRSLPMLFAVALLPFPTGVISRYFPLAAGQQIYLAALLIAALAQLHLFALALRPGRYLAPDVDPAYPRALLRRARVLPLVVLFALLVTLVAPMLGVPALIVAPAALRLAQSTRWERSA